MNILNINKEKKEVVIKLSSDELVKLTNVLYHAPDADRNSLYYKLHGDLMIARDLAQYGHIDDYCLGRIVECRNKIVQLNC